MPLGDEVSWRTLLDQAAGPVALLDLRGWVAYANPAMCGMLGRTAVELVRSDPRDLTHPDDPAVDAAAIGRLVDGAADSFEVEKRYLRPDGRVIWALLTCSLIRTAGEPAFVLAQVHDVTERREAALRWQRTVAHAPIGMALLDLEGRWTEVNDRFCELVGRRREELVGLRALDLTYPADREQGAAQFEDLLAGRAEAVSVEKRYRHRDGYPFWVLVRTSVVPDPSGRPAYLVAQYDPIGEVRTGDRHLAHLALHDPLTGLANRTLLTDRLGQAVAELRGQRDVVAVLLLDLDGLKPVNDAHGHLAGDRLLIAAVDELLRVVRAGDTAARFGGDEFVVLTRVPDVAAAEALRDRVAARLDTSVVIGGERVPLSASVGLACTREPGVEAEELLRRADRDMYRRKAAKSR